jgi:hypothetical protein
MTGMEAENIDEASQLGLRNHNRARYHDVATQKRLVFLTNTFFLPALTITQLYRCEAVLSMDQTPSANLSFLCTSENAVRTQVWVAVAVYVLVAIVKKRLSLNNETLPVRAKPNPVEQGEKTSQKT